VRYRLQIAGCSSDCVRCAANHLAREAGVEWPIADAMLGKQLIDRKVTPRRVVLMKGVNRDAID
jgi:hypothetical protein